MRRAALLALSSALALATPVAGQAPTAAPSQPIWRIDRTHSELTFRIRHLVSRVSGHFGDWSGTITVDPANLAAGTVAVEIKAASIDTDNERRDNDLRSDRFFDVARFPLLTFRSTRVEVNGSSLRIHGDLTIRDVTRAVVLEGEYLGRTGSGAQERLGFAASTRINRLDYGVTWNRLVEGGGSLLGDEVTIEIAIAAVRADGA